jgi:hypothetical protein
MEGRLNELEQLINSGAYRVDAQAVAREMLAKASLIRRARIELEGHEADRTREARARRRHGFEGPHPTH